MKTSCRRCGGYIIGEGASDYYREKRWRCINCGWYCEESVVLRSLVVRLSTSSC